MTNKIKELAQQAGLIAGEHDDLDFKKNLTDKEEKFAELIVRECIEINKQELAFNAFERLMNKYKEHFGVEE